MRRTFVAGLVAVALAAGGAALAPSATAATCNDKNYDPATCPTARSTTASSVTVRYAEGSAGVTLKASFTDAGDAIRDVVFLVTGPGEPGGRTVYLTSGSVPAVSGTTKTYTAVYNAYNFKKPGAYKVTATASTFGNLAFKTTTAPASFTVKHQSALRMYASNAYVRLGEKAYFYGYLYPDNGVRVGQKIVLSFKAKGAKKWKKKDTAKVKTDGKFRTGKQRMAAYGKWRVTFKGSTYVLGSKATMTYRRIR